MAMHGIAINPIMKINSSDSPTQRWYTDDDIAKGSLDQLKNLLDDSKEL